MVEIWKYVDFSNGICQVSSIGGIRYAKDGIRKWTPNNNDGYPSYTISVHKKKYSGQVHRLVAKAFIPNPENKPCVNHKNGVKNDNRVENLEWCTHSENMIHSFRTGIRITQNWKTGRVDRAGVIAIRDAFKSGHPQTKIATYFGLTRQSIKSIAVGKTYKYVV